MITRNHRNSSYAQILTTNRTSQDQYDKTASFTIGTNFEKSKVSNFDSAVHVGFDSIGTDIDEELGNKSSMQYFEETS